MQSLPWITGIGLVVLAGLIWFFIRTRNSDLLEAIMQQRRSSAKVVSRAEYVDGMNRIAVALALTENTFFYENPDLPGSFELSRMEEVEYDDELSTGHPVQPGFGVLRLRTHGTPFDFVMTTAELGKWRTALPAHRLDEPTKAAV